MRKTIAQAIQERTRLRMTRDTLLMLLREKYKNVPTAIEALIEESVDVETLQQWALTSLTARRLRDIPFNDA